MTTKCLMIRLQLWVETCEGSGLIQVQASC